MLTQQVLFPTYSGLSYSYPGHKTRIVQPIVLDSNWLDTWPTIRSVLLGSLMMFSSAAVIALEIANVSIESNKDDNVEKLGMDPSKVGVGIWCGSISFLASICILIIIFTRNKRIAATFALIAVTLAFFFTIVLIGLSANSVQRNQDLYPIQYKLIIAILSIALFILTQCIIFFMIYISVFFSSETRISSDYY
ncbi:hypothetical protein I4U23_003013 [Adineta vaga]|nr:hypothetical protein I4U23_003013 [Adineta vaga]